MSDTLSAGEAVISFLDGRKGFGWWWDELDSEIQQEITDELTALVGVLAVADIAREGS